jgi:multiple sugar transport system ATP-binding protein
LDEPLSNLDAKLRVQTRTEITKLHQKLQTTFIYVTHDQVEAMTMASRIAVMNFGVLQQIDTPQSLYDRPDNLFVAGFIGSPAMNFFEGKLGKDGGNMFVHCGTFSVKIPDDRTDVYTPHDGKAVIFGLRPEDIHDPKYEARGIISHQVEGNVEVTELMGNEIFVFLKSGEDSYVARIDPRTNFRMGDKVNVTFNMGNMHIFDKETEQAIR